MEPLCKPTDLDYTFRPKKDSSLAKILNSAPVEPAARRSTQGAIHTGFDFFQALDGSEPAVSQESRNATDIELEQYAEKFSAAMRNFSDIGDADDFAKQLESIIAVSLKALQEKRAFITAITTVLDEYLEPENRGGLEMELIREIVEKVCGHFSFIESFSKVMFVGAVLSAVQHNNPNGSGHYP